MASTSMIPVTVPRGYHFHPTDEQLISYYLKLKVEGKAIPAIPDIAMEEVELYGPSQSKEPWKLFGDLSTPNVSFYVFSKLETTSRSSKKIKRVAGRGTWDLQNSTNVFQSGDPNKTIIGLKRMFRFEMKRAKDLVVPRWIMHEYTLSGVPHYALCEIKHIVSGKDVEADQDLDLGVNLEKNKRVGSARFNGGDRRKRVRVDDNGGSSSFVPPTLAPNFGGSSSFVAPTQEPPFLLLGNGNGNDCDVGDDMDDDKIDIDYLLLAERMIEAAQEAANHNLELINVTDSYGTDIINNANNIGNGGYSSNFGAPTYYQGSDFVGSQFQFQSSMAGGDFLAGSEGALAPLAIANVPMWGLHGADNTNIGDGLLNNDPLAYEYGYYDRNDCGVMCSSNDPRLLPNNGASSSSNMNANYMDPAMFDPRPLYEPPLAIVPDDLQQQYQQEGGWQLSDKFGPK